jgi:hypothetical protein
MEEELELNFQLIDEEEEEFELSNDRQTDRQTEVFRE